MIWSKGLKKHHKRTEQNSLNGFTKSSRIKIPKYEKSDLTDLQMKIKETYRSYEERTIDIKTVDIASKVVVPGGIAITTIAGIVVGSPALAFGGGVIISLGFSAILKLGKSKMKLKSS